MTTNKLFVSGIPYRTTEDELRTAFEEVGEVLSVNVLINPMNGQSRGYGFIEMVDIPTAQAAIDRWDGKEYDGRMLSVSAARPKGERPPRDNNSRGGGYGGGFRGGYGNNGGGDRGGYNGGNRDSGAGNSY